MGFQSPPVTEGRGMAHGRKSALTMHVTPAQRHTLLAWQRATTVSAGLARRGRLILLVADGVPLAPIAAIVGIRRRFVYTWVRRFVPEGVAHVTPVNCGATAPPAAVA